ncbi:TetR/AcrR family transcriptional regulator [Sphingobium subterraneum]|uniref:AcrR family transcriptional regulator n=1 Tax=Sphingobium subterraneum TaxID=627688 RepID=A0A841IZ35_9SPHN|nr:TetR/AcrR family transcriptional regulator [Sphingobium subterraneum]MBB6123674.1 AcrR family transcriptional regulator [Sphingobium subterraneum]
MNYQAITETAPRGAALLRPHVTRSIWRAAIIELARVGYDQMSMDAVAKRAGVGKAALYRRWNSKEAMVVAMITAIELEIVQAEDRGSLRDDIKSYVEAGLRMMRRPLATRILPDLYAEMCRDTLLAKAIRDTVYARKRISIVALLDRAIQRGELSPGMDVDLAFDVIAGTLYWRVLVSRSNSDDTQVNAMADGFAAALKAMSPP